MLLGLLAALVSFVSALGVRCLAWQYGLVDRVSGGRKIHARPTPLLGGVAVAVALLSGIFVARSMGLLPTEGILATRLMGFCGAILVLLVGGVLDDKYNLKPGVQIIFPVCAALVVIGTGTSIVEVSSWGGVGTWRLDTWQGSMGVFGHWLVLRWPADVLTLAWLLAVTYATKAMDGIDGLVTGHTVVGAGLIILLASSPAFYQASIIVLTSLVLGAFVGFLPWNFYPAKQFLGETGSTLAGFSLGFLAIVSGAKVATAFMALGIPLVDFAIVVVRRVYQGRSPFQGDDSHLHFCLLRLGFSQRQAAVLYWLVALMFGFAALGLQTRGKVFLMLGLVGLITLVSLGVANISQKLSSVGRVRVLVGVTVMTSAALLWSLTGLWRGRYVAEYRQVMIHDRRLRLEIADEADEWRQGLGGRWSLANDEGMLFVFPTAEPRRFWMQGMSFDLDLVWLLDGRIVEITQLRAPRGVAEPEAYTSKEPVDRVLELRAGRASAYGLRVGEVIPELRIR